MKKLLIIPMAIFEIILIIVATILTFPFPRCAEALTLWAQAKLPNKEWYLSQ